MLLYAHGARLQVPSGPLRATIPAIVSGCLCERRAADLPCYYCNRAPRPLHHHACAAADPVCLGGRDGLLPA